MLKSFPFFLFLLIFNFGNSQIVKDTTFTDHSEYVKNIKKYPIIKPVEYKTGKNVSVEKDILYKTDKERSLNFDALCFISKKRNPAVIIIHGGGWKSGDKKMMFPLANKIAENGFNCFNVEYRLSGEAKYPAGVEDVLDAIKFIKSNAKQYNINQNKITILGVSSGGQMAALIGEKYPDLVNAVIDIDGILAFHHPESAEGKVASEWLGGTYEEVPKVWEDASALNFVTPKSPPILFINSQFVRFHAGRDDMILKLKKYKIDYHVEAIPGTMHTFWMFHPWFEQTVKYINTFLDQKFKS